MSSKHENIRQPEGAAAPEELTEETAAQVVTFGDGSKVLVGKMRLIDDPEHGKSLFVPYQAVGPEDSEAWAKIGEVKAQGDKELLRLVQELHAISLKTKTETPAVWAGLTGQDAPVLYDPEGKPASSGKIEVEEVVAPSVVDGSGLNGESSMTEEEMRVPWRAWYGLLTLSDGLSDAHAAGLVCLAGELQEPEPTLRGLSFLERALAAAKTITDEQLSTKRVAPSGKIWMADARGFDSELTPFGRAAVYMYEQEPPEALDPGDGEGSQ